MHHTKTKGDLALAKVIADLVERRHMPCVPLSEHQPYDLVVVLERGNIVRVQVKFAKLQRNGTITVKSKTCWADKNGLHTRRYQPTDFDYYALYCPERGAVVYIPNVTGCPYSIRFEQPGNQQRKHVKWAVDYCDIK